MKQSTRLRSVIFLSILLMLAVFQVQIISVHAQNEPSCKSWLSYDSNIKGKTCTEIYQNCDFWVYFQNTNPQLQIITATVQILKNNSIIESKTINNRGDYFLSGQGGFFCIHETGDYTLKRTAVTRDGEKLTWKDKSFKVLSSQKCGLGISVSPSTLYVEVGQSKNIRVKFTGLYQKYSGEKEPLLRKIGIYPKYINHKYANYSFSDKTADDGRFNETTDIIIKGISPGIINTKIILEDTISNEIIDQKPVKIIVTKKTSVQNKINVSDNITKVYSPGKSFYLNAHANSKLSYTVKNKRVAAISSSGKVTMKSCGSTAITIKAAKTNKYNAASKHIMVTFTPGKATIKFAKPGKTGRAIISWNSITAINSYQFQCSTSKNFSSNVKTGYFRNATSKKNYTMKIPGLTSGKTWYIRMRAYAQSDGKRIYGTWSNVKEVLIK